MESETPRTDAREFEYNFGSSTIRTTLLVYSAFARQLERELAAAIRQRDEARRDVCRHLSMRSACLGVHRSSKEHAAERGWDCFKEATDGK